MGRILITGANRGLGLELACQYAEAGAKVLATCRDLAIANALKHLKEAYGDNVELVELDVTDELSVVSLASLLKKRNERIDLFINNAGVLYAEPFGKWSGRAFANTFETNVAGPALLVQAIAPILEAGAAVVNMSSALGSMGLKLDFSGDTASYAASKAALNMITVQAATALAQKGVIVAAFSPGWVKTEMGGQEADLEPAESVSQLREQFAKLTPDHSGKFFSYDGKPLPW